jgi:hypothetical protein
VWQSITSMARWDRVRWINATRNRQTRERPSKSVFRSFGLVSDGRAASISQHAPSVSTDSAAAA